MHFRYDPFDINMYDYSPDSEIETETNSLTTILMWAWISSILMLFVSIKYPKTCGVTEWEQAGYYRLTAPQTLTKGERDLLRRGSPVNFATLYKSTCRTCDTTRWKYKLADTWVFPTATSVEHRAMDESGNPLDIV
jgi:hypothetical protein